MEEIEKNNLSNLVTFMLENLAKSLNTGGTSFKYLKQVTKEYIIDGEETVKEAIFHIYTDNKGNKYMETDGSILLISDEELQQLEEVDDGNLDNTPSATV